MRAIGFLDLRVFAVSTAMALAFIGIVSRVAF
ncbi:hypothetical protein SAMN05444163_8113 [Bradyrhizobium ottawaense]|uniref:Uncharacterized protein n=1 Tax=Bradyrhizobium ottawaense TaxID=931866 RepID=A0ABY0QHC1_9BRAD|nr:hypothetical protein SAMN05444163_8113 [Bradyrhizobium ottawaense]